MNVATRRKARPADASPPSIDLCKAPRALVLQGGGALGAYQAGAYEALAQAGVEPQWVAGVSIGAINSALIAGNAPEHRVERLREFWELVSSQPAQRLPTWWGSRGLQNQFSAQAALLTGIPGFFLPRPDPTLVLGSAAQALSYYDTAPLKATLERLVDFDRINSCRASLAFTVGAVDVRSGESRYFSNGDAKHPIRAEHVMASGALPPGFPPVHIDGRDYWDGGLVSNTPVREVLLRRDPLKPLVVYQVDLFNAHGLMPTTMSTVMERQKDIMYASRTELNKELLAQRHAVHASVLELLDRLPASWQDDAQVRHLREQLQLAPVQIYHLIYKDRPIDLDSKDYEFSRASMLEHWEAGLDDMHKALRGTATSARAGSGVSIFDGVTASC
jgi:NTE family protein